MERVVVTGMGIVSPLGNSTQDAEESLRKGRSGITYSEQFAEMGFASKVWGMPPPVPEEQLERKLRRQMAQDAIWAYFATSQAIANAYLMREHLSHPRTGVIIGTGGACTREIVAAADTNRAKKSPRTLGAFVVPKTMSSGAVANAAVAFKVLGANWALVSACATSAHCIIDAARLIRMGEQDVVLCGGGESLDWSAANAFDAMTALSRKYNDTPEKASRPYDAGRDGFVIAGGAGTLVLESLSHARRRGAPILAELAGYGFSSDGEDMFQPSGEGAERCMRMALNGFSRDMGYDNSLRELIGYINTHGTATELGDKREIGAIRNVFGDKIPPISSTKSLSGHGLGAAGVWEAIFSILMLRGDFLAASANIETLGPEFAGVPIVMKAQDYRMEAVLSNSFGFGGTNATLIFKRYHG